MNRNLVFAVFAFVVTISIAGITMTAYFRPDATATVLNAITILLTLLSGFAITAHGLTQLTKKVEEVHKQTNGTLSKKDDKIEELTETIRILESEKK